MLYDFIEYWAASRLLLAGKNPYSLNDLLVLQQSLGWEQPKPHIMWNPPWTLAYLIPFGSLDFQLARFLWIVALAAIALSCANHLWKLYGGSSSRYWIAWLVTLSFAPTVFSLLLQQIGLLSLLGLVGFLHFDKQRRAVVAGASLSLVAVKPHLYYLFWAIFFVWSVKRCKWNYLAGFGAGILLSSGIAVAFHYRVFDDFISLYLTDYFPRPLDQETPTIARALRHLIDTNNPVIQLWPTIFGLAWVTWYWNKHEDHWDWLDHLPLLLLVSITTNCFAWSCDHVVVLPALLQATAWCFTTSHREILIAVALYALVEISILLVKFITPDDFWYFWLSLVWCWLYLAARNATGATSGHSPEPCEQS